MEVVGWLFAAGVVLTLLFIFGVYLRNRRIGFCPSCYFPLHRCDCPSKCSHNETWPIRWTQDGWATRCKRCGDMLYFGDDYDAGPR